MNSTNSHRGKLTDMQQPQQQPVDPDQIYQSFDHNLYKITGDAGLDNIMDILNADTSSNNSSNVQTSASDLGGGVSSASTSQATGSATQAGKQSFADTTSGYWLGVDPATGIAQFNIGNGTNYITWDGTTLTIEGGANVTSINIPDTTTAESFHVDSSGNSWWGANVASGYAGANAYVLATGAAVFKNVQIGGSTVQYVINNSGIFSYGDGSDGAVTWDGTTTILGMAPVSTVYTLTRDIYISTGILNSSTTIKANGYRIFASVSLTVNGTIDRSGNNGTNGSTTVSLGQGGGPGGAAVPDGYLKGSTVGGNGGGVGAGPNLAANVSNSIGVSGVPTGGVATPSNVKLIANWHLATLLDVSSTGSTVKFTSSGSSDGGSGTGTSSGSGGGGGGASAGGVIAIYARSLTVGATGTISSNGGTGGNGSAGGGSYPSGGQGGGGGSGGVVVLIYNVLNNSGSITANAGLAGSGGGGNSNGNPGVIYEFQLSL